MGRKTSYETEKSKIPYDLEILNIGAAMNLSTGVFTAPVRGIYQFSFHGLTLKRDNNTDIKVQIWVNNDFRIGHTFANANDAPVSISGLASLKKGDQVYVWVHSGKLYDSDWGRYTTFSGMLLEEEVIL